MNSLFLQIKVRNLLHRVLAYFKYYLRAKTIYSVHSPYLFEFMRECVEDNRHYYAFDEIEWLRSNLARNHKEIEVQDLGAGSSYGSSSKRKISSICNSAVSSAKQCQFLFRLVKWKRAMHILELGTSLGISTQYINAARRDNSQFTSIEGAPSIYKIAKEHLQTAQKSPALIQSDFDSIVMNWDAPLDLVLIDGNHTFDATLNYIRLLKPHLREGGIFVLDDIYWSKGMTKAWKHITQDPDFAASIDLFDYGLLVKNAAIKDKSHVAMIPWKYKPWHLGLWG